MSTYTGGSISTGKLVVNGNITLDASGANAATIEAVQINATTVTGSTINADNFNFKSMSLDLSGNLVVRGTSTLVGATNISGATSISGATTINNTLNVASSLAASSISTPAGFTVSNLGAVRVPSTLSVTGTTTLNNAVATNVTSTNATVTNLTSTQLTTPAGFVVDVSANVTVPGSTTMNNLLANGQVGILGNVLAYQNSTVLGNNYVAGNAYVNNGLTVGDALNGNGVTMRSSGATLDVSGNLSVKGTTALTGAVTVSNRLTTTSGFAVDLSGNVSGNNLNITNNATFGNDVNVVDALSAATFSTPARFSVDASANLTVPTNAIINSLYVPATTAVNNFSALQNSATVGGQYVGGNVYANRGVTVGDTSNGNGVTIITTVDTSLNNFVSLNNCPAPAVSSKSVNLQLPIYINGVQYFLLLST